MALVLKEAEESRPPGRGSGIAGKIEYHERMAGQFEIYADWKGDDFNGVVFNREETPSHMKIAVPTLCDWHKELRRGTFDHVSGIGAVKETVVAAGGTMEPPKIQRAKLKLSDVPSLLQQYKDAKGDDFDGTVHQNDSVPGIGDCGFLYLRLAQIISGRCDQQDGIAEADGIFHHGEGLSENAPEVRRSYGEGRAHPQTCRHQKRQ